MVFLECLEGVLRVSAGCLESVSMGVWYMSIGGILRVSEECSDGVS